MNGAFNEPVGQLFLMLDNKENRENTRVYNYYFVIVGIRGSALSWDNERLINKFFCNARVAR